MGELVMLWMLIVAISFVVLTTWSNPPARAEPKDATDRCLTTLYNYPADETPKPVVARNTAGPVARKISSDTNGQKLTAAAKK